MTETVKMIDFVKLNIKNPNITGIRNNPLLEWDQLTNETTGDVKRYSANFHGLTVEILYNQFLNIAGSVHKFWNTINRKGGHNYNDLKLQDLTGVIMDLCKMLDLEPGSCTIENFEFGVNVLPPITTTEVLQSVINHKGKPFERKRAEKMYYLECEHRQYYVKIYDKGLQYGQGNILRYEVKTRKMEIVRKAKVRTLPDLLNPDTLNALGVILRNTFNEILFYDNTVQLDGLPLRERIILTEGMNPAFWENYKKTNPDNYFKKRDRFKELLKRYGQQDLSEIVGGLISDKWDQLLTTNLKTLQDLTGGIKSKCTEFDTSNIGTNPVISCSQVPDLLGGDRGREMEGKNTLFSYTIKKGINPEFSEPIKKEGKVELFEPLKKEDHPEFMDTIKKGDEPKLIHPKKKKCKQKLTFVEDQQTNPDKAGEGTVTEPPRRYCQSCGNDITHQRGNSKFCSARYYGEKHAHQCRNRNSNPRNNPRNYLKRAIEKDRNALFDTLPYFVPRQRATT
jgi:hypothetical protein